MRSVSTILILVGCIAANTMPRWVHPISIDLFCKWQAVSFVLLAFAAVLKRKDKILDILFDFVALLAVNNMVDEVCLDPTQTNGVEIFFAITITTWTGYRLTKCHTSTR